MINAVRIRRVRLFFHARSRSSSQTLTCSSLTRASDKALYCEVVTNSAPAPRVPSDDPGSITRQPTTSGRIHRGCDTLHTSSATTARSGDPLRRHAVSSASTGHRTISRTVPTVPARARPSHSRTQRRTPSRGGPLRIRTAIRSASVFCRAVRAGLRHLGPVPLGLELGHHLRQTQRHAQGCWNAAARPTSLPDAGYRAAAAQR